MVWTGSVTELVEESDTYMESSGDTVTELVEVTM